MDYNIETIYALVGKEDKIAGLTLKYDSEAYNNFGVFITVIFLYNQKEREKMDELIQNDNWGNHDYVKAKYLGIDLEKEKVTLLEQKGIKSKDIAEILSDTDPSKNTFHSQEKRELNKIEIPFQSQPNGKSFDWMYGFSKKQVQEQVGLSPRERAFYLACKIYYEPEELTDNEKQEVLQDNGKLDIKIEWELLQIKYTRKEISEGEKTRLVELYVLKKEKCYDLLDKYLIEAGSSLKKLAKVNIDQATELLMKVMHFQERRLTVTIEYPIYLNLDRYLHIYMRHTEEFQVTEHFEDKDNFQWNESDVFSVMSHVIEAVEKEYNDFRKSHLNKRYSRYGDYSLYFEGDYYTFHIEADGRLSTFHKNRKRHDIQNV